MGDVLRTGLSRAFRVLGSLHLACVLIVLLMVLTFLGTLAQVDRSLYEVQETFFASGFFVHEVGGMSVPLPGGYLLLSLLFVNLVVGGMIRMRRRRATVGVLVIHVGIAVLLAGAFVEERWSQKGSLTLHEGEAAASFHSDAGWEVAITEHVAQGKAHEVVVPAARIRGLRSGGRLTATSPELPFDLVLHGYLTNARPRSARAGEADSGAEGYVLESVPAEGTDAVRAPGVYATVRPNGKGPSRRGILWALEKGPFRADVAGRRFDIDLRRETWDLPFTLRMRKFVHEKHPGTNMPRRFSSYVTKIVDGEALDVHITMNEPLRSEGYTVYQSGWGPRDALPGTPLYSTFSVVRNPSDRWPILACTILAVGLVIHWTRKLIGYLRRVGARRPAAAGVPA